MAAETVRRFGIEPKVALLSHSNFGSSKYAAACKMRQTLELVRERAPELMIDGEMQGDTAVVPEIIEEMYPFSRLKGGANVLIFPDLQSANITMNLLKRLGGAVAIGPIQIGLASPIHVIRNTATVEEIVRLTAIAVVDAQKWLM